MSTVPWFLIGLGAPIVLGLSFHILRTWLGEDS